MKYPPSPVAPLVRSFDKRAAISGNDRPFSFVPVALGDPSGASAVYCLNSCGSASISPAASSGLERSRRKGNPLETTPTLAIHCRRDDDSVDNALTDDIHKPNAMTMERVLMMPGF